MTTGAFLRLLTLHPDMAYPKPVPAFTPEAFEETLDRVEQGAVSDEEIAAVEALRADMKSED